MAPRIYFLLSGKSQLMYEKVLDLIIEKAAHLNCAIQWSSSMTDFEFSIFNALGVKFPNLTRKGCHYHFCQAVLRRVLQNMKVFTNVHFLQYEVRIKLDFFAVMTHRFENIRWYNMVITSQVEYNDEDTGLRRVIKKLIALAFLRCDRTVYQIEHNIESDVITVFAAICLQLEALVGVNIDEDDVNDFIEYFGNTWITYSHRWNVFSIDKNRTNNHMEGWHLRMNKRIKANPNLWQFIISIKVEQTAKEVEFNQMNNGAIQVPLTRRLKDKERRLASLKVEYNTANITPLEYNLRVSHMMGF